MTRSEADKTIGAVARALAGNHPPEVERILIRIANRAAEADEQYRPNPLTGDSKP